MFPKAMPFIKRLQLEYPQVNDILVFLGEKVGETYDNMPFHEDYDNGDNECDIWMPALGAAVRSAMKLFGDEFPIDDDPAGIRAAVQRSYYYPPYYGSKVRDLREVDIELELEKFWAEMQEKAAEIAAQRLKED